MNEGQMNFQPVLSQKIETLKSKWSDRKRFMKDVVEPLFYEISKFFKDTYQVQLEVNSFPPNYQNVCLSLETLGKVTNEMGESLQEDMFFLPFLYKLEVTYVSNQGEIRPKIVAYFAESQHKIDQEQEEDDKVEERFDRVPEVNTTIFTTPLDPDNSLVLSSSSRFSNFHEVSKEQILEDFMTAFYDYQEKNL